MKTDHESSKARKRCTNERDVITRCVYVSLASSFPLVQKAFAVQDCSSVVMRLRRLVSTCVIFCQVEVGQLCQLDQTSNPRKAYEKGKLANLANFPFSIVWWASKTRPTLREFYGNDKTTQAGSGSPNEGPGERPSLAKLANFESRKTL